MGQTRAASTEPAERVMVPLASIVRNKDLQTRATESKAVVAEYAEQMRTGHANEFPPLTLFDVPGRGLLLVGGWHRMAAAELAGLTEFQAEVIKGAWKDALLAAAASNATHGLQRSAADKRRAVAVLLNEAEYRNRSDRWLADLCRVSRDLVEGVRKATGWYPEDGKIKTRRGQLCRAGDYADKPPSAALAMALMDGTDSDDDDKPTGGGSATAPSAPRTVLDTFDTDTPDDDYGCSVPNDWRLREAFDTAVELKALCQQADSMLRSTQRIAGQGGGELLPLADLVAALTAYRQQTNDATASAVCPHCDGEGLEPAETGRFTKAPCTVCTGRKWLPVAATATLSDRDRQHMLRYRDE